MDEKNEKEVIVVTVVMRYDSSAYLRLIATDVDMHITLVLVNENGHVFLDCREKLL
jgi:hypothetical protein